MKQETQKVLEEKIYENMPRSRWNAVKRIAAGYNLHITRDRGEGQAFGVTIAWSYFEEPQSLWTRITDSGTWGYAAQSFVDGIISNA